jgi:hypothetical protein
MPRDDGPTYDRVRLTRWHAHTPADNSGGMTGKNTLRTVASVMAGMLEIVTKPRKSPPFVLVCTGLDARHFDIRCYTGLGMLTRDTMDTSRPPSINKR